MTPGRRVSRFSKLRPFNGRFSMIECWRVPPHFSVRGIHDRDSFRYGDRLLDVAGLELEVNPDRCVYFQNTFSRSTALKPFASAWTL